MFWHRKKFLRHELLPVRHQGIFRRQISLFEGVALIVSGTIGAGVLGLPFAIAKVGVFLGILYILGIGALMTGLNLLLGRLAVGTGQKMQLVGLAGRYLGRFGKLVMTFFLYFILFGVLVVYIIGEGEVLAALFGGNSFFWSSVFFAIVATLIYTGIRTIKVAGLFLSLGVLLVVLILTFYSAPHIELTHLRDINFTNLLFPYGVLLFAFHGTSSVPEAYSILINKDKTFKKAIVIAGIIVTAVYAIFALVVVGVTGGGTTEIATIALGEKLGTKIFLLGNIFALLAMGTSCIINGLVLCDSMEWDFKLPHWLSTLLACGLPFLIFILGFRGFIRAIDIVGGVFIGTEMLLILFIYWRAKQAGDLPAGKFKLHHATLLAAVLLLALTAGVIYSIVKLTLSPF